jgi:hypothetical protein
LQAKQCTVGSCKYANTSAASPSVNRRKISLSVSIIIFPPSNAFLHYIPHPKNFQGIYLKSILNGERQNSGSVTIKMLCDALEITLGQFFNTPEFDALEQEMKLSSTSLDGVCCRGIFLTYH